MRFEIGPGGAFVILLGLAGLSGGVFALGLMAGHELARPEQNEAEQAAVYPLPSPPAVEPSPSVSYTAPPISGGAPGVPAVAANNPAAPGLGANPGSTAGAASSSPFGASAEGSRPSAPPSAKKNSGPMASTGGDEEGESG